MGRSEELTEIVIKVLKDKNQFELLYSKISNKVYFWCYTIIGNESDAKDAAQEAIIKIYNNIDELKSPGAFSSWMYRLVRNSCINYLGKHKKENSRLGDSEDYKESIENTLKDARIEHQPNQLYNLKETNSVIKELIDNLPRRQREVITLYYLEEYSINEIAEILDYNTGSIRSRLHSARKNLQSQINDYQIKNNVKLYSSAAIPTLSVLIKEYQDDICSKQNVQYNQNTYANTSSAGSVSGGASTTTVTSTGAAAGVSTVTIGGLTIVTTKLIILIVTIVCVCAAAVIVDTISNTSIDLENVNNNTSIGFPKIKEENLYKDLKEHPYIEDISYLVFPMRQSVDVKIELKDDIEEKDIEISFNNQAIFFEKKENIIYIQATQNGVYKIVIKKQDLSFKINNIDKYAPELVEVFNENGCLEFNINDELSQIDYNKSFIKYQGETYAFPKSLKIKGEFIGAIRVVLYCNDDSWIEYSLDIK